MRSDAAGQRRILLFVLRLLLPLLFSSALHADDDRLHFLFNITVATDETVSEAVCIACSITVRGTVQGEAVAVLGGVAVEGRVGHEVVAIGGNIEIEGRVDHETVAVGGDIRLGPTAEVGHEVVALGGRIDHDPQAALQGNVEEIIYFHFPGQRNFYWQGMLVLALSNFAWVLLSDVLLRPRRLANMAAALRLHPFLTSFLGMAIFLALGSLYSVADFLGPWEDWGYTILNWFLVGVPALGYVGLAYFLGQLGRQSASFGQLLLAGAAATTLLLWIPAVGFILFLLVFPLGFGLVVVSGLGTDPHWLPARWARRRASTPA